MPWTMEIRYSEPDLVLGPFFIDMVTRPSFKIIPDVNCRQNKWNPLGVEIDGSLRDIVRKFINEDRLGTLIIDQYDDNGDNLEEWTLYNSKVSEVKFGEIYNLACEFNHEEEKISTYIVWEPIKLFWKFTNCKYSKSE